VIRNAGPEHLEAFFVYLNDHLIDNGGAGNVLFMPMARGARFPEDRQDAFKAALATPMNQPGWRRLWLALAEDGSIAGHIDLRARPDRLSQHRVMLGMGVQRNFRQIGLGKALIEVAADWAAAQGNIGWIDLEVLSVNLAARRLYTDCAFVQTGEIADLFRIDGNAYGEVCMSRKIDG
jgi:RimJ/RimL family protein N-acetyltransferase